jgi:hypothetical protein
MLVSRAIASRTGSWRQIEGMDVSAKRGHIHLTIAECREAFVSTQRWIENCERIFSRHNVLSVTYEELTESYPTTMESLLKFLSVPIVPLTTTLQKQTMEHPSLLIDNYNELQAYFANTEWGRFFDERPRGG